MTEDEAALVAALRHEMREIVKELEASAKLNPGDYERSVNLHNVAGSLSPEHMLRLVEAVQP